MDPIEAARTKIKQYRDDCNVLAELYHLAMGEADNTSAGHFEALLRKTIADAGAFCATLVGVTPEGEPAPE
jgi:hypothetical protein